MDTRTTQRKGAYKKTLDADDCRRKRQETKSEISKNKREEGLLKKRREGMELQEAADPELHFAPKSLAPSPLAADIPTLVAALNSPDPREQFDATLHIRKLLSIEKNPPIDQVIASGAIVRFVQYLTLFEHPKLQLEAAWALTNIASGNAVQTKAVIESGAIPHFVQLLRSPKEEVREQAGWAIGNIAGDGAAGRDLLLQHGVMQTLLSIFVPGSAPSFIRTTTWTLSNLCRGKPPPKFDVVKPCLPLLVQLLQTTDAETLTDACWAVTYLSDGPNEKIKACIDAGVCPHVVNLLSHSNQTVRTPALRAVGNIVTGDESQTQAILDCNPVPRIVPFLISTRKGVPKEACWVISNIAAGTSHQIQVLIEGQVFPPMIRLMSNSDFEVKREICWAISNAVSGGTHQHIAYLVKNGCVKPLCEILETNDPRLVMVALETVENILLSGASVGTKLGVENAYTAQFEEFGGSDILSDLQNHKNEEVYKKAMDILETYFGAEEDSENAPANTNNTGFQFGGSSNTNNSAPAFSF